MGDNSGDGVILTSIISTIKLGYSQGILNETAYSSIICHTLINTQNSAMENENPSLLVEVMKTVMLFLDRPEILGYLLLRDEFVDLHPFLRKRLNGKASPEDLDYTLQKVEEYVELWSSK